MTTKLTQFKIGIGQPKIVLPLMIKNISELETVLTQFKVVATQFDMIEWRIDFIQELMTQNLTLNNDLLLIAQRIKSAYPEKALLVTCRTEQEGGYAKLNSEQYFALNQKLVESQYIDFIDIEYLNIDQKRSDFIKLIENQNVGCIISMHNFTKMPIEKEIIQFYEAMKRTKASLIKMAFMAKKAQDVLTLLSATLQIKTQYTNHLDPKLISIAMGEYGKLSRISGELFGSVLTFGSYEKASAPGQIEISQLKNMLNVLSLTH